MNNQRLEIVAMIRKRFLPLVRIAGPQYAGSLTITEYKGSLYLGELSNWLWMAPGSGKGVLTDEEVASALSPHELVRFLIFSASDSMALLARHLDRIEASSGDTEALLLYYLTNIGETVVDGIALDQILGLRIDDNLQ